MSKRVLSIGQCIPDQAKLSQFLETNFNAVVVSAATSDDAVKLLREAPFDLILINRKLDTDYSDGIEVLRRLMTASDLPPSAMMLVSNFPDAQADAMALGAMQGFGKLEYEKPETRERLAAVLG